MSLTELLPAIRALPKAEQVQLLHLLIDGVAATPAPLDREAEALRAMFPPGVVAEIWSPLAQPADAASWAALSTALTELPKGAP